MFPGLGQELARDPPSYCPAPPNQGILLHSPPHPQQAHYLQPPASRGSCRHRETGLSGLGMGSGTGLGSLEGKQALTGVSWHWALFQAGSCPGLCGYGERQRWALQDWMGCVSPSLTLLYCSHPPTMTIRVQHPWKPWDGPKVGAQGHPVVSTVEQGFTDPNWKNGETGTCSA